MNDEPQGEPGDDQFDELREAAGAVVDALKRLVDATERVIEKPGAFAGAVESGRSVVEAFLGGFASQADPDGATADGDQGPAES